jgi:hypothetical protein
MSTVRKLFVSTACTMALFYGTAANAQATRTWVSGVGDDVNPCSRTAPCKTFAGAISKTAAGGEINCLDPGGFGAVSINKSLTINCIYTEGGMLAGGNGISINDTLGPTPGQSVIFLRGLDIFGVNPPSNGVRIVQAAVVHIEDSTIRRFNASNSVGVSFVPNNANARLFITNTTIAENGSAGTGGGIDVRPASVGSSASVVLNNVRVINNANNGIRADSTNGAINIVMEDSNVSGNVQGISVQGTTNNLRMMINDSTFAHNSGFGIIANGGTAVLRVGDSTITGNTTGVQASGGALINSYGDNRLESNPTAGPASDGVFSGVPIQKK